MARLIKVLAMMYFWICWLMLVAMPTSFSDMLSSKASSIFLINWLRPIRIKSRKSSTSTVFDRNLVIELRVLVISSVTESLSRPVSI